MCVILFCALIAFWYADTFVWPQIFEGSIVPCNSMMVVDLGASECRIEAVMHDFVQVRHA